MPGIDFVGLHESVMRFFAWERNEFISIFPPEAMSWLLRRSEREVIVKSGASFVLIPGLDGKDDVRISAGEIRATSFEAAVARRGLRRGKVAVVLEMPASDFLVRRFDVPLVALRDVSRLVESEIERRTPFRRNEVLAGHRVAVTGGGKATIWMAVIRRDLFATALESSGIEISDLSEIRSQAIVDDFLPQVMVADHGGGDKWFMRLSIAMAVVAAALMIGGVLVAFWRQGVVTSELDRRISEVSAQAGRVREVAEQAGKQARVMAALSEYRARSPFLGDVWEEISQILPDSAFVTSFHLSEAKAGEPIVEFSGFAQSAVGIPVLFSHSKLFSEASFTAPITVDAMHKQESFSLRLKMKPIRPSGPGGAP